MELDPHMVQNQSDTSLMEEGNWKRCSRKRASSSSSSSSSCSPINNLDDGCLMHIFSFLPPIPDRFNTALVCHRWNYLACHPRLWLRVDRSVKELSEPGVFPSIETAVAASRPGDTILIAAGGVHCVSNIQIKKPICLVGAGELPDDTTLICSRGADSYGFCLSLDAVCYIACCFDLRHLGNGSLSIEVPPYIPSSATFGMHVSFFHLSSALEFLSTCKLANLTVKAELGCCLLHRKGRLTIDGCILQCETNPLDYLSCPIVSTANSTEVLPLQEKSNGDGVFVSQTRIEGGAKAVLTSGDLSLQRVRVIYARTSLLFWFDVEQM